MIKTLHVQGYRLLDNFDADLGRLTVVIGANATGKSTLIDCLRLISETAELPLQKAIEWHGWGPSLINAFSDKSSLEWVATFEKPQDNPRWQSTPLENNAYTYDVSIGIEPSGQAYPIHEILPQSRTTAGLRKVLQVS